MGTKKVFICYDHSEDLLYKNMLKAWDANTDFDFEFDQRSPDTAINSLLANVVQSVLTGKMKEAEYILVLVGKKSYTSKWMNWEISRAQQADTNLKFAVVRIDSSNVLPSNLPRYSAFAPEFTLRGTETALNNAKNN